ncbi:DEAD/DEAH box helicase [Rhizobium ruizarguesonis]|uniref:DEAD/DEAH box helicase n=1 Tax=Rhizobium ruizarguesonis TaxID=2081791 RepID=UPI001031BE29|nr:DEAD/DEAH box helicase [Rhizobium ruizarguesonis]TAZ42055.1 DEAD/DEAH box helicase [Rhizobium ruizarguesonis]TBA06365.1 DEAD/DEAH box helicase [Rhizobium ruizarguesonis]
MTFALELSNRLVGHEDFSTILKRLETCAAATSIDAEPADGRQKLEDEDMAKLHYCARVFVQTDDTSFRRIAQSIALNTLLLRGSGDFVDKSIALLTDLGNFPAVDYARRMFSDLSRPNLLDGIGRELSRVMNSIKVGADRMALTDFQKEAWDSLPNEATVAISAPTAAGKSFLVIEHLCRLAETRSRFRAVYIAPTRALLAEVHDKISRRLAERGDVHIATVPAIDASPSSKHIYVLTQERLQFLLALDTGAFDLVVVDEAQNLSDGPRGMILQECLEQITGRDSLTRLILLAPGAGGFQRLADSLGKKSFHEQRSLLPTVLQNRIVVRKASDPNSLDLHLLDKSGPAPLGVRRSDRRFDDPATRLAAVALELGSSGGSLVYATGADKSETVASKLASGRPLVDDNSVDELALFIRDHVHKEYGLADHVRHGVAFHYGKMPTLLRETIEAAFRNDVIKFLACTTTLFQGVNLPARNVFIDTPKRGSGALLDAAQLWNFAGRAGRMKEDIVGNVFLVDYDDWEVKPLDEFVGFRISPAFEQVVNERHDQVVRAVQGDMPRIRRRDEIAPRVRAAAGLLISKAALGTVSEFVARTLPETTAHQKSSLIDAALAATDELGLPDELLMTNWTVNPYGLKRLYQYFLERIEMGRVDELIPPKPHEDGAREIYKEIFKTVQREINETSIAAGSYHAVVGGMAVRWMKGVPYPSLISLQLKRARREKAKRLSESLNSGTVSARQQARLREPVDVDAIVRRTFDMIEDEVRFQYVQLGKAYVDLLRAALIENNLTRLTGKIFNFPVALELGVATKAGWSFMELGLSRISAAALESHFKETNATVKSAREWLATTRLADLRLSPIIVSEITRLGLSSHSESVAEA